MHCYYPLLLSSIHHPYLAHLIRVIFYSTNCLFFRNFAVFVHPLTGSSLPVYLSLRQYVILTLYAAFFLFVLTSSATCTHLMRYLTPKISFYKSACALPLFPSTRFLFPKLSLLSSCMSLLTSYISALIF
jgi:hypothetical protein